MLVVVKVPGGVARMTLGKFFYRINNIPGLETNIDRKLLFKVETVKFNSDYLVLDIDHDQYSTKNLTPGKIYALEITDEKETKFRYYELKSFECKEEQDSKNTKALELGITEITIPLLDK